MPVCLTEPIASYLIQLDLAVQPKACNINSDEDRLEEGPKILRHGMSDSIALLLYNGGRCLLA